MKLNLTRSLGLVMLLSLWLAPVLSAQTASKKVLTLEGAKKIAAAAEAEARKNQWSVAITVVDDGGNLIYLQRMDGTQIASIDISQFKARGAIGFKRPTKEHQDLIAGGSTNILRMPWSAPVEGGLPLVIGGEFVGAIGVSGVTGPQDSMVAAAGAAATATMK
jgi:uncharacterized protein GlcG (DUF336 family)